MEKSQPLSLSLVDADKLNPHPALDRHFPSMDEADLEMLKESLKAVGLIHPVVANSKHEILSGRSRVAALLENGEKRVLARFFRSDGRKDEATILAANLCVWYASPALLKRAWAEFVEILSGLNGHAVQRPATLETLPVPVRSVTKDLIRREVEKAGEISREKIERLEQSIANIKKGAENSIEDRRRTEKEKARLEVEVSDLKDTIQEIRKDSEGVKKDFNAVRQQLSAAQQELEQRKRQQVDLDESARSLIKLSLSACNVAGASLLPCAVEFAHGSKKRKGEILQSLEKLREIGDKIRSLVESAQS